MNRLSFSGKSSMLTRVMTGVVLSAVLLPCIVFGNWSYFILLAFLSIVGIWESLKAPGSNRYGPVTMFTVYVFVLSFIFWNFIKQYLNTQAFFIDGNFFLTEIFVSIIGIILYALCLFLIAIFSSKVTLNDVTYLFTMGIVFALGFQGMFFIRYFPNSPGLANFSANSLVSYETLVTTSYGSSVQLGLYFREWYSYYGYNQSLNSCLLLVFVFMGTWLSDVGAYFVGVFFGKHRMNPRISPHKTWEGFFGGMLFSVACSLGFAAICEYCFHSPLVPGLIQFSHSEVLEAIGVMEGTAWPFLVLLSVLMPIVGNIGGFLYSLVKRQYGIKDYGKIFPGHGGVIDRFDSIMINSISTSIIVLLTANGWVMTI